MAGDEFAALLGQLKERSGLSYGTLGKRLHLSASTLHRYVNGDAVPVDYAPVERLARLCRATPDELVELHRLWVRADVSRQRKGPAAGPDRAAPEPDRPTDPEAGPVPVPVPVPEPEPAPRPVVEVAGPETAPGGTPEPALGAALGPTGPETAPARPARRFRRTAVVVGTAVAAAVSMALVVSLSRAGTEEKGEQAGASARPTTAAAAPSATRQPGTAPRAPGQSDGRASEPTVAVAPHTWESPCSQHYLVDRQPEQVPPPPMEQDASGWVGALAAVPSGEQLVRLTVQGAGERTVVLEALHVRVVSKGAPLAWNDYAMGVGCGGGVSTKTFAVDLDAGRPAVAAVAGQRKFPYQVSESDPEVFYVTAHARAHDVAWYLELTWSSGKQRGTIRVDDKGRPFRTSGNPARPAYAFPLGGAEWIDDEGG
ncbi:helix-turn-helix domain-containing protein [Streptomyces sp. NPDC017254]|uniref:helix-turn-helix domain-containing protein n=1 Tax=unclassified Streptomyces TaxID=2593676 RepID=UPI0037BC88FB